MNGVVCQGNPVSVPPTHSGKLKSLKVSTPTRCRSQDESKNNKAGGKTIPIVVQEELEENPSELEVYVLLPNLSHILLGIMKGKVDQMPKPSRHFKIFRRWLFKESWETYSLELFFGPNCRHPCCQFRVFKIRASKDRRWSPLVGIDCLVLSERRPRRWDVCPSP